MSVIDKLPKHLEDALPSIRDKWIAIGKNTDPADKEAAEIGCDMAYTAIGLEPPKLKIWLNSPIEGAVAAAFLPATMQSRVRFSAKVRTSIMNQVKSEVSSKVKHLIKTQIWEPVGFQIWDQIGTLVWDQVSDQIDALSRDQVLDKIDYRNGETAEFQTGYQIENHVLDKVFSQIKYQIRDQLSCQANDYISLASYGQHDAYWLGFYSVFETLVPETKKLSGLWQVAQNCGWWWRFDKAAIFTDRPKKLSFDQNNKLHCEDGPAIEYRDGFKVYAWHGIRIEADLIENKNSITHEKIRNETNTEIARCMIEIIGTDKFLKVCNAEKIHEDEWGKLWRADIGQEEPYMAVEVLNSTPEPDGTFKTYFLSVHPELRPIPDVEEGEFEYGEPQELTVLNAIASTFGLRGEEYKPHIET